MFEKFEVSILFVFHTPPQIDDTAGFPSEEFEVVSGSLEASFDSVPAGSNVSHAVVLKPLTSGMHNFVPAVVKYTGISGEEMVRFCFLISAIYKL